MFGITFVCCLHNNTEPNLVTYFQRLTLEGWFTNLEQTPLNRCQQLPEPYRRLIHDINITNQQTEQSDLTLPTDRN